MTWSSPRMCILTALVPLLVVWSAGAQNGRSPDAVIEAVDQAYRDLDYERAEEMARGALSNYQRLTVDQLIQLHRLMAIIQISQNDRTAARRQFEAALSLDPNLSLDPTYVSPKIIDFYEKVRKDYLTNRSGRTSDAAAIRYRLIEDPRPSAALRSAVLPGWGQLYVGEMSKGRWMMAGWGASVGGAVAAHLLRAHAIDSDREGEVWKDARSVFLTAAAGLWLGSYLDALLTRPDPASRTIRLGLRSGPSAQPMAAVRVRF